MFCYKISVGTKITYISTTRHISVLECWSNSRLHEDPSSKLRPTRNRYSMTQKEHKISNIPEVHKWVFQQDRYATDAYKNFQSTQKLSKKFRQTWRASAQNHRPWHSNVLFLLVRQTWADKKRQPAIMSSTTNHFRPDINRLNQQKQTSKKQWNVQ